MTGGIGGNPLPKDSSTDYVQQSLGDLEAVKTNMDRVADNATVKEVRDTFTSLSGALGTLIADIKAEFPKVSPPNGEIPPVTANDVKTNGWLVPGALVAFMRIFSAVVAAQMELAQLEGKQTVQAMNNTLTLGKDQAANTITSGKAEAAQDMTAAFVAGASLVSTGISLGRKMAAKKTAEKQLDDEDKAKNLNTPDQTLNNRIESKRKEVTELSKPLEAGSAGGAQNLEAQNATREANLSKAKTELTTLEDKKTELVEKRIQHIDQNIRSTDEMIKAGSDLAQNVVKYQTTLIKSRADAENQLLAAFSELNRKAGDASSQGMQKAEKTIEDILEAYKNFCTGQTANKRMVV